MADSVCHALPILIKLQTEILSSESSDFLKKIIFSILLVLLLSMSILLSIAFQSIFFHIVSVHSNFLTFISLVLLCDKEHRHEFMRFQIYMTSK